MILIFFIGPEIVDEEFHEVKAPKPASVTRADAKFDALVDDYKQRYFSADKVRSAGKHWYDV